ncbi:MAG: acyl-CoA dehydrogenase family protein [Desulfobacterales bacterium]|nr:acyl-CoA dehydrogenase family protein [Desulfobacterales bacterium]
MSGRRIFRGGEFLIHDAEPADVFTPEDFSKEHRMVLKAAADFVKKELEGNAELIEEKIESNARNWLEIAGELGLNATDIPEAFGGEGMDKISACLVSEAMGAGYSFAVCHTCQTGIGSLPIFLFGTEAQKKKYLPKLATGEYVGAYCLTESGAGSDAMNAATTATLSADGSHYLLNGEKIFITNGAWADVLTVFAKVDGEHFTGFIVEKGFEGFSVGAEEKKLGIKGSSTVPVIMKDCKVPKENVLFEIGQGHKIAFNVLNIGRYKLGATAVGAAKAALARTVPYANERQQFGRKISSFGMIRKKFAQMAIDTYMAESVTYRLAAAIEDKMATLDPAQKSQGAEIARAIEEYSVECAIVKVFCSEALDHVVDDMVQIFGGNGYIAEYPAARAYRDSRINRIFEGTNEINRLVVAGNILKYAMKGRLPLMEAVAEAVGAAGVRAVGQDFSDGPLACQADALSRCKELFLLTVDTVAKKLLGTLSEDQEILELLADMIIQIYTMESGLLRAKKVLAQKGEEKAALHLAAIKVYMADAVPKTAGFAKEVFTFAEAGDELTALAARADRLAAAPMENTVALRRTIADKVIKARRYPYS